MSPRTISAFDWDSFSDAMHHISTVVFHFSRGPSTDLPSSTLPSWAWNPHSILPSFFFLQPTLSVRPRCQLSSAMRWGSLSKRNFILISFFFLLKYLLRRCSYMSRRNTLSTPLLFFPKSHRTVDATFFLLHRSINDSAADTSGCASVFPEPLSIASSQAKLP